MGDINQLIWVRQHQNLIKGPVIEIGSRHYSADTSIDYRSLCNRIEYLGVDASEGTNVDLVIDFTQDYEVISKKLGGRKFNTVICCSVLEHVDNIFKIAKNISGIIEPGGVLFVSVPFTWEFHGYPSDYWRFTPAAIEYLFPNFSFDKRFRTISSNITNDITKLDENPNPFILGEHKLSYFSSKKKWLPGKLVKLYQLFRYPAFRKEWLIRKLLGQEYRLALSCINMVGIKNNNIRI